MGPGVQKMDSSHTVTNPAPRRGGLAITPSKSLPNAMSEKEPNPRGGGARINGNYNYSQLNRSILIVELPAEILVKIMNYMSFNEISQVRLVSKMPQKQHLM